jgi:predicted metal-dependent hydrolase
VTDAPIRILRHPRARRMRLAVDPASGDVRLTLPPRASAKAGMAWAAEKAEWIAAQRARLPRPVPFDPGATFPFADGELTIDWSAERPRIVRREGHRLICGGPADAMARRVTSWLKAAALQQLREDSAHFAARAGVTLAGVAIGDPRARWGSCSSAGAIRYSWRLILAPGFVRRATVAHEIGHRLHMDHSPAFHAAVARILGDDPAPAMAWLRRHGASLYWIGRSV